MESADDLAEACRDVGDRFLAAPQTPFPTLNQALGDAVDGVAVAGLDYLPVAALLPSGRPALEKLAAAAESGFRWFKWKVGTLDWRDECVVLDDLCGALPSGARLRLDANGAWDRRTAERWLERAADRPIEFVEQPISPEAKGADDLLLGLAGDFPTPLALDESLIGERDLERWLGSGWPGYYVFKPALFADADRAAGQLAKAKARVIFSSSLETAVGARAALARALRYPHPEKPTAIGFGVWPLFADRRFDGPHQAPFIRREDVAAIDPEGQWTALA